IRERVVDHLPHIDTKLAEAVGANLGIELSADQRNTTLPASVNGVEKDPSLSLYADAEGEEKGLVVACLLNDRTAAHDLLLLLQ
ncbi:catalase HPII, partial [Klebsiella pneumoniae]|nr:catalase HPII [Klebsiella pneumoniae]